MEKIAKTTNFYMPGGGDGEEEEEEDLSFYAIELSMIQQENRQQLERDLFRKEHPWNIFLGYLH